MDAHVMRGGAPAARGEDASQEQDRVEQDGDMDCDQEPSDDIEPVVTNSGGHNGYLLCSQNPTRPAAEFGGFDLDAAGSCELLSGEHKGQRVWCFSDGSGPTQDMDKVVKCLRKYRSKQGDSKSTFVHLIMCAACGKLWRGTGLRRLMGHFERVARGKGRAGVQQCSKLARIEADADQMTQIQRCLAAMQETSQSRQQKKSAPTQMYAQNLGSKAVVVMQQSMATWMSKAKMTPQQASSSLAADAAVLRFAIQGGISFAHAGGVVAQHLATRRV